MKPLILIGVSIVAVISVAAIAFAATGGDGDSDGAQILSPTATTVPSETPIPVEPDGGIGNTPGGETPIPVEPDGGIGNTPDGETPIPVEPDGGIGDGAGPIPVEPDGGIGNTPDSEKPMPSEPKTSVTPVDPQSELPPGRYAEFAPIESIDLSIAESFPPQYFLHVVAGLPSGCAQKYTHSVTITSNQVDLEVLNSFPEGNPICTLIYGIYEVNVALGSDFVSGQTYKVSVNDGAAELEFTAQ